MEKILKIVVMMAYLVLAYPFLFETEKLTNFDFKIVGVIFLIEGLGVGFKLFKQSLNEN